MGFLTVDETDCDINFGHKDAVGDMKLQRRRVRRYWGDRYLGRACSLPVWDVFLNKCFILCSCAVQLAFVRCWGKKLRTVKDHKSLVFLNLVG